MKYRKRIYYSDAQKALMWDRWKEGVSLNDIARMFNRGHSSIAGVLSVTGGIRPSERKRHALSLTLSEREAISRGLAQDHSIRSIARQIGRIAYRATSADQKAWGNALQPKLCKLASRPKVVHILSETLNQQWSPQQIAGWLKRQYPNDEAITCPMRRSTKAYLVY